MLIIVQNLPVPFDRRVWLECRALRAAGYEVSVVCPKSPGDPVLEVLEDVRLYKYAPYPGGGGAVGFIAEYVYSFTATAALVARAWRHRRIDALQACNPPDIFWPLGLVLRLFGCRYVFDHHDLCPELYESRFPHGNRLHYWGLRALEWCTFRSAEHVISTNASYREKALRRGGKRPEDVTIVRTGPDADCLRRAAPDVGLRRGRRFLVAYIGVMGPQDGVDVVVEVAAKVVNEWGRKDISFALMGSGDCFDELVALKDSHDLGDFVEFMGRVPDDVVTRVLSTADVGLSPDRKNPLNDVSTMNKTLEYMSFSLPTVAFDLRETRVSAGEGAAYAEPNEVESFARVLVDLLDDEARRSSMGAAARSRVEDELAWSHQRDAYLGVYEGLLGTPVLAVVTSPSASLTG
ncbi:MAG TPA: glycosyltransferase family 4 protein [Acidimicrobiales bacterium]|nr:glycosyltransferase family 4 protein [Acidimicrobiales bacterium]